MLLVSDPTIDNILNKYKTELGQYSEPYKNHVYRVFNLAMTLGAEEIKPYFKEVSISAAFHDLGIWTDQSLDYLHPSVKLSFNYIHEHNLDVDRQLVANIIENHHRLNRFGDNSAVESFRKADMIDLSRGLIRFGINKEYMKQLYKSLPSRGFHLFIFREVIGHSVRNPFNPFPMLRI
jgi:hypothetical protein